MCRKQLLAIVAALAACSAASSFGQNTMERVVAIHNATADDGNAHTFKVLRGQLLTVYQRSGGRAYVYTDARTNTQQGWGWIENTNILPIDQAAAHFTDCLKKDANDAGAYLGRAAVASAQGKADRVIADCDQLLRLDNKSEAGYYLRGCAFETKKNFEKAIADFSDVLRLDPKRSDALRLRAALYQKQKRYGEAIADLSQLLKLTPNQSDVYYNRGIAHYDKSEYRKALDDFNEALAIQPDEPAAYRGRGLTWDRLREFEKAEDDFSEAIRVRRSTASQWCRQIWYCLLRNDFTSARTCIAGFSQVFDFMAEDFTDRARCRWWRGEDDKALADFDEALRVNPCLVRALESRGRLLADKKHFALAMADYDLALRLDPKLAAQHRLLCGSCRSEMGLFEAGRADLEAALRLEPDDSGTCNALAWFLATCGDAKQRDGKRAVELATKACKLTEWESSTCIDTLAAADAEAGDFAEAVHWQQKALELAPPAHKHDMSDRLALYTAHKTYREPVTPDAGARKGK